MYAIGLLAFYGVAVSLTMAMFLIPAFLISGKSFIVNTPQQLRGLMALSALQLLVAWLNGLFAADATGFRMPIWPYYRHPFLAPFMSAALLGLLFPSLRTSTPSGTVLEGEREREVRFSNSVNRRLRFLIGDSRLWTQLLIIVSIIFSVILAVKRTVSMDISFQHQLQRLSVSVLWPPACAHWTMLIVECWKPVSYVVFPPKYQSRETLLNRDPITKTAYPSEMAKSQKRIKPSQRFSLTILGYVVLVLAYVWTK